MWFGKSSVATGKNKERESSLQIHMPDKDQCPLVSTAISCPFDRRLTNVGAHVSDIIKLGWREPQESLFYHGKHGGNGEEFHPSDSTLSSRIAKLGTALS